MPARHCARCDAELPRHHTGTICPHFCVAKVLGASGVCTGCGRRACLGCDPCPGCKRVPCDGSTEECVVPAKNGAA